MLTSNEFNLKEDQLPAKGLTEQQMAIINSKDKRILIEANAGAAKTTTVTEYAKRRPFDKKLYIVFNKAMADEMLAENGSTPMLEIRTTFSLAYKYEGYKYAGKIKNQYSLDDFKFMIDFFPRNREEFEMLEDLKGCFEYWISSNKETPDEFKNLFSPFAIQKTKECWAKIVDRTNGIWVTHGVYMKMWALTNPDLSSDYDIVICDESQDMSESLAHIIKNSGIDTIVAVGDRHQALYGFAGQSNGYRMFNGFTKYELTNSFRVNNTIGKVAEKIFNFFEPKESLFSFTGVNNNNIITKAIDTKKQYVHVCRTNREIFYKLVEGLVEGKTFFIEGQGKQNVNFNFDIIKQVFNYKYFSQTTKRFAKYKSYEDMKKFASEEKYKDVELIQAIDIVESLGVDTIKTVDSIMALHRPRAVASVIYGTVHMLKGKTIKEPLLIGDDFTSIMKICEDIELGDLEMSASQIWNCVKDELFCIYVAITRGAGIIQLNKDIIAFFNKYLNVENTKELLKKVNKAKDEDKKQGSWAKFIEEKSFAESKCSICGMPISRKNNLENICDNCYTILVDGKSIKKLIKSATEDCPADDDYISIANGSNGRSYNDKKVESSMGNGFGSTDDDDY